MTTWNDSNTWCLNNFLQRKTSLQLAARNLSCKWKDLIGPYLSAFILRLFLLSSPERSCLSPELLAFSSPEPSCSHLQNLPVLIFITFLFSSPEPSCSLLQNLPVLISRTFLFLSPEPPCSHLQNTPVLISRTFLFSSPESSCSHLQNPPIFRHLKTFFLLFRSITFSFFEPRLVPSPSILYIYIPDYQVSCYWSNNTLIFNPGDINTNNTLYQVGGGGGRSR